MLVGRKNQAARDAHRARKAEAIPCGARISAAPGPMVESFRPARAISGVSRAGQGGRAMEIVRAPRYGGFCGGVKQAWSLALQAREATEGPVYVTGELIHNRAAMAELQGKGVQI